MAKQKVKPIHFIITSSCSCRSACNIDTECVPIENKMDINNDRVFFSSGTFNVEKVTCKKCLKNSVYKEAVEKSKYPLFFWKEGL